MQVTVRVRYNDIRSRNSKLTDNEHNFLQSFRTRMRKPRWSASYIIRGRIFGDRWFTWKRNIVIMEKNWISWRVRTIGTNVANQSNCSIRTIRITWDISWGNGNSGYNMKVSTDRRTWIEKNKLNIWKFCFFGTMNYSPHALTMMREECWSITHLSLCQIHFVKFLEPIWRWKICTRL